MLWMLQRVALGPVTTPRNARLADLTPREIVTLLPLAVIVFGVGLYPGPLPRSDRLQRDRNCCASPWSTTNVTIGHARRVVTGG